MLKKVLVLTLAMVLIFATAAFAADDNAKYNFENGLQGWTGANAQPEWEEGTSEVAAESGTVAAGSGALKLIIKGDSIKYKLIAPADELANIKPGKVYTYKFYVPADSGVTAVQPYVQFNDDWSGWKDKYVDEAGGLVYDQWFTVEFEIPADVAEPIQTFGVMIPVSEQKETAIYVDSIDDGSGAAAPAEEPAEEPAVDDSAAEENPTTGDFGMIPFLAMAAVSGAALLKRRNK